MSSVAHYLTTSWDDGDPEDLRLAERLALNEISGTFYLCRDYNGRPRLTDAEIVELASFPGTEIGAHSLTHPDLRKSRPGELNAEVTGSKAWLQDLLGQTVSSFCYPNGLHNKRAVDAVQGAGYTFARTTKSSTTGFPPKVLRAGTSLQLYSHPRHVQIRHALKEVDVAGLRGIAAMRTWPRQPALLSAEFAKRAATASSPQLLHLWGHSWEFGRHGLWTQLDQAIQGLRGWEWEPIMNRQIPDLRPPR